MRYFFPVLIALFLGACNQHSAEEYLARGENFANHGDWPSAIIEYKNSLKQQPDNAMARAKLGQAYVRIADADSALLELNRALELGYSRESLLLALARAYRQKGDFPKIIDEITEQDTYSPELKADVLSFRGVAFLAMGDMPAALEALNKARRMGQERTEVRLAWSRLEKANNNPAEQKNWLKPLLDEEAGVADAWSQYGEIEQQAKNFDAAERAYTKSIELRAYAHGDSIRRALVRIAQGNLEGAQEDIDALLKAGAAWPAVRHTSGIIALERNQLDQAQSHFQWVLSRFPNYSPSQFLLATVHHRQGQYQNAIALLEQYLARQPNEYRPVILYTDSLLKTGKPKQAAERLKTLNQNYPGDARLLAMLSQASHGQGKTDLALEYLEQAIEANPEWTDLRLRLAAIKLNDPARMQQGRTELVTVLKQDPKNLRAYQLLYASYLREKKFAKARRVADKVTKLDPENALGLNMSALAFYSEANREEAAEILTQAMSRFPGDALTINNLARIKLRAGELEQAKTLYQTLLEHDESNTKVLIQLARIAASQQNPEESLDWIRKAYERNPNQLSPKLFLASSYLRNGEASRAIDVLNSAGAEQRDSVAYIMLLAQAKLAVDEVQHAIRLTKKMLSNNPDIPAAHFLLAQSYAMDQKPAKMRESLMRALELNPEFLQAHLALARLDLFENKQEAFEQRVDLLMKRYPKNGAVLLLAAKLDSREENYGKAVEKLSTLIENTSHPEVALDLAANQWNAGDRQGAISSLELWTQEHKYSTEALLRLAEYYLAENHFEFARDTYRRIEKFLPDQPVVLNNLAWTLKDVAPEEGLKYAKRAHELAPDNPLILDTLGTLYLESGNPSEALATLEAAASKAPHVLDIQINYARALASANKADAARSVLAKLLEHAKTEEQRRLINLEMNKI